MEARMSVVENAVERFDKALDAIGGNLVKLTEVQRDLAHHQGVQTQMLEQIRVNQQDINGVGAKVNVMQVTMLNIEETGDTLLERIDDPEKGLLIIGTTVRRHSAMLNLIAGAAATAAIGFAVSKILGH